MSKFICKASGDATATNYDGSGINPDAISIFPQFPVQATVVERTPLSDYWRQAEPAERVYLVSQMAQIASAVLLAVMLIVTLKRR